MVDAAPAESEYGKLTVGGSRRFILFGTIMLRNSLFPILLISAGAVAAATRVAFVPFESSMRLKGTAWDLSADVPRWFSETIDTIAANDTSVRAVPLDAIMSIIRQNGWNAGEYRGTPALLGRLASSAGADMIVTGRISRFNLMKRSAFGNVPIDASAQITQTTTGQGGVTVIGSFGSYTADIAISISVYESGAGALLGQMSLDSKEKDAGFNSWFNFQLQNAETDFSRMGDTLFGSRYFQRSVAGVVMKQFSLRLHDKIKELAAAAEKSGAPSKDYMQGKILERRGDQVYLDLGSGDQLLQGEQLTVLRPDHPLLGDTGDTLGWADRPAGAVRVRFIKAKHFSQAAIISETDSIQAGWSVQNTTEYEKSGARGTEKGK
jgi:hypothetical protein